MNKYEEYLAKARARSKAYYEKVKDSAEFKEKKKARWRKWYKKKKEPQVE